MVEIFPSKFTPVEQTVAGQAARLIVLLNDGNATVGQLYARHKASTPRATFESFAAALTLLYAAGVVSEEHQIVRIS